MRYAKTLRILGIALILSLLVIAIPAAPAQAARDITLSPEEGDVFDEITISGDGFNESTDTTDRYTENPNIQPNVSGMVPGWDSWSNDISF